MPKLPERKVGLIACSGEELAEGTVTRLAALKVLHQLRPQQTVTICLPLFLAGGEDDRTFARYYPTITIDGCALRCAAHGTEKYSAKPAMSLVVSELAAEHGLSGIEGRRRLNHAGCQAVELTAQILASAVDQLLAKDASATSVDDRDAAAAEPIETKAVSCCCCTAPLPLMKLIIEGKAVEVVALPLIFAQFREAKRVPNEAVAQDLLEMVKSHNTVHPEAESAWREVLIREYEAYCEKCETIEAT
jgi:uncharacterized metal-binding protein